VANFELGKQHLEFPGEHWEMFRPHGVGLRAHFPDGVAE
jgi:hypothetical protein